MRDDHRVRQLRRELRKLLPHDKDDVDAIARLKSVGYPSIEPILLVVGQFQIKGALNESPIRATIGVCLVEQARNPSPATSCGLPAAWSSKPLENN